MATDYSHNIKFSALMKLGVSTEDMIAVEDIYNEVANRVGDSGSCVIGNGLFANGTKVLDSYAQGSIGLEEIQQKVVKYLKPKYPEIKFRYDWGVMD